MTLTSIISAIGNNNSIFPLLIRDCGIENPTKVFMTYRQNKSDKYIAKNALRERIIDEYATSAIWLGGIPLVGKICDGIIKKKGFNPNVNTKLLNNNAIQNIDKNISKFKDKTPQAVEDLIKIKNNTAEYKKLLGIKLFASIAIPTLAMGFILPKLNFGLTKKLMKKKKQKVQYPDCFVSFEEYNQLIQKKIEEKKEKKNISFGSGLFDAMSNLSTVQKMAITDGGLSVGRVATARNKNEGLDNAIKMTGMMYLNYVAPKQLAKILDKLTKTFFKLNVNLDPIILDNPEFVRAVKTNSFNFPLGNGTKEILDFIDENPTAVFCKLAQKTKLIKMVNETTRDPRAFVNTKDVNDFMNNIKEFCKNASESGNIDSFIKRAKKAKCFNVLANVVISSFLLAFCLPKVQFFLRNLIIKNKYEPGLTGEM